jgi:hypothetical protein
MQDLLNGGIGIKFTTKGGVILVNESDEIYLGKVSLEKDGSYTAIPGEYKYGTVWECKPQEGFVNEHYAALYLTNIAATHSEYSNVCQDEARFIKWLIKNNF